MPTTEEYINQLKLDKQNLVNNLVSKGVQASDEETFTSLVPKVLNIEVGTEGGIDTSDGTATASDILEGKIAYSKNERIVGTLVNDYNAKIENYTGNDGLYKFITKIGEIDISNVTNLLGAFASLASLKEIPKINTSKATVMMNMFSGCTSLVTIPELDAGKVVNTRAMFQSCSNLTNVGGLLNLGKAFTAKRVHNSNYNISLTYSPNLTHESLMNVINKLYDLNLTYNVAGGGTLYTQTLNLGPTNIAKLTPEELAIGTNKGWTIS